MENQIRTFDTDQVLHGCEKPVGEIDNRNLIGGKQWGENTYGSPIACLGFVTNGKKTFTIQFPPTLVQNCVLYNLLNIVKGLCGNDRWLPAGTETLCMMLNLSGTQLFSTLNIVLSKWKPCMLKTNPNNLQGLSPFHKFVIAVIFVGGTEYASIDTVQNCWVHDRSCRFAGKFIQAVQHTRIPREPHCGESYWSTVWPA